MGANELDNNRSALALDLPYSSEDKTENGPVEGAAELESDDVTTLDSSSADDDALAEEDDLLPGVYLLVYRSMVALPKDIPKPGMLVELAE